MGGQIRSVLCSAEGSTRMDNYVYFRDNCIFHKDFIICPVTNMEDILDQIKHFTITKLSFLNVPGQII